MSLSKITACLASLVALAVLIPSAQAQHEIHHVPPLISPNGNNPDFWHPFVDTTAFPHDFQFFAPAEFGEFGGGEPANTGWFATYDRVYIYMSRPEQEPSYFEGDFTWGNRFSLGYMSQEDHGWLFEFWHISGPNHFDINEVERVNVLELDDQINSTPGTIVLRDGEVINEDGEQNQGLPRSDQNHHVSHDRRYFLQDSVNAANVSSWELNKTIRWEKLHYGSTLEPFFGFRYMKYEDNFRRDSYTRITDLGVEVGQIPPLTQDPTLLQNERFDSLNSFFVNHMVGGQIGARWFKNKGRWNLSSELRAFMFTNFQSQHTVNFTELTFYDATGVDEEVEGVFTQKTITHGNAHEFVFGGEVRAEAAYEVTRDLALRFGMTFTELATGIGRGNSVLDNSQNVTMVGMTFGIDFRR